MFLETDTISDSNDESFKNRMLFKVGRERALFLHNFILENSC